MELRRRQFIDRLERGRGIDLRAHPRAVDTLRGSGISEADLRALAGRDHAIRGSDELGRLYDALRARGGGRLDPAVAERLFSALPAAGPSSVSGSAGAPTPIVGAGPARASGSESSPIPGPSPNPIPGPGPTPLGPGPNLGRARPVGLTGAPATASPLRTPVPSSPAAISGEAADSPARVDGHPTARALTEALDISGTLSRAAYDRSVAASPRARERSGFFAEAEGRAAAELSRLDRSIAAETRRSPPDLDRIADLTVLQNLAAKTRDLYAQLKVAHSSNPEDDAGEVLARLAAAETALTAIRPQLLGEANHRVLQLELQGLGEVVGGFAEMRARGEAGALDTFALRTYRRLQQIESGQRRRSNEPASIDGALQTYRNDQSDAVVFRSRFRAIQDRLGRGQIHASQQLEQAMLEAVPGTSTRFREGVRLLARARWQTHAATAHADFGNERLQRAVVATQNAFTALQAAEADLGMASQQAQLSQHALTQQDAGAAREAVTAAARLRAQADAALRTYTSHLREGRAERGQAQAHLAVAAAYVRASEATLTLIDRGGHGRLVASEAAAIRGQNAALNEQIRTLSGGAIQLRAQQVSLERSRQALAQWSTDIGAAVAQLQAGATLQEVEDQVHAHVGEGASRAHELIASSLDGVILSPEAQAFLRDPSSLDPDDAADVREELTAVFARNPAVAQRVAGHITQMRASFQQRRAELVAQHGENSDPVRGLDTLEHGYLQSWLQKDAVVVEALLRAGDQSAGAAAATGALQGWIAEARGRYSRSLLSDPARARAASTQFHDWMVQQPSLNERYQEVVADYGAPSSRVPMTLHLEQSGQLVSFDAYVFRDGETYKALNPLDGRVYSADTAAGAVRRLAAEAELGQGTLRWREGDQILRATSDPAPEGSLATDIGMGVVGVIGTILVFAPEPTTLTKWGGGAMVAASSTYFVGKGSMAMYDLIEHETFGNNAQTWGAALDIASGVFMGLRGAGALSAAARTESQVAARLYQIGQSAALTQAELASLGAGVGLAAHGMVQIYQDTSLSDREKVQQAGAMLAAFAIPAGLVAGHRGMARVQSRRSGRAATEAAHENYLGRLQEAEGLARRIARSEHPEVRAQLRRSLDDVVARARTLYDAPAMSAHPELQRAGRAAIDRLDQIRTSLPEAPRAPSPAAASSADASHPVEGTAGLRETVGWSGEPTATPRPDQPHLAAVHRGLESMPATTRGRLAQLAERVAYGSDESNQRIADINREHGRLLYELSEAHRRGDAGTAADLQLRIDAIPGRLAYAEVQKARQIRTDRAAAVREMVSFRESLLGPEGPARARAEQISMDPSVRDPQAVREAATMFFRLTGDLVDPTTITARQTRTRGNAERGTGHLDVGGGSSSTILHELAHFGEWADPSIHRQARSWRDARAEEAMGEVRVRSLNELTGTTNFEPTEVAVEDHFERAYAGKLYGDGTSEVFTTGLETFANPSRMLDLYMADPEQFHLTVGLLRRSPEAAP